MAFNSDPQVGASKGQIIDGIVQRELKFNSLLLPTVDNKSALLTPGHNSIKLLTGDSITVANRTPGTAGTQQLNVLAGEVLNIDQNAYSSTGIDSFDIYQSSVALQEYYAARMGAAHARYVDTAIIAKLVAHAGYSAAGGNLDESKIIEMLEYLKKNFAVGQSWLVTSPNQESEMLKIANFVRADAYGSSNVPNGVIGKVYGANVLVHAGLADGQAFIYTQEAIAIAFQQEAEMVVQLDSDYGTKGAKLTSDQVFGLLAVQQGKGTAAAGKSPWIASLV